MVSQSYNHEYEYPFEQSANRLRHIANTLKGFRWFEWLFFVIGAFSTLLALLSVAATGIGRLSQSGSDTSFVHWLYQGVETKFWDSFSLLIGIAPQSYLHL